jgi:hypothetical protein
VPLRLERHRYAPFSPGLFVSIRLLGSPSLEVNACDLERASQRQPQAELRLHEWYGAGFEQIVDDARFQARTRPHTFVDQWADAEHEAWSAPLTSPCGVRSERPDRVVLFAANWKLPDQETWQKTLEDFVTTVTRRYPGLRDVQLFTVLRGPGNRSCGDSKSVVEPMIDAAIAQVARAHAELVHVGPKLEAADCSLFEKGGPHFTEEGRKRVAVQLAEAFR